MNGLRDKRVVVTRATAQAEPLNACLRQFGAHPLAYPCIEIRPPADIAPLMQALHSLKDGDWLVLTSANTVDVLADLGVTLPQLRVGAVGRATADAARSKLGFESSVLPETFTAESLAEALPDLSGQHVMLPQSALADSMLADRLRERGAHVTAVTAYENGIGSGGIDLRQEILAGRVDAITFTSASTVHNALRRLEADGGDKALLRHLVTACIGPKTADAAQALGLNVCVVPAQSSIEALCAALDSYFQSSPPGGKEA